MYASGKAAESKARGIDRKRKSASGTEEEAEEADESDCSNANE